MMIKILKKNINKNLLKNNVIKRLLCINKYKKNDN